jgi:hypothetical protein
MFAMREGKNSYLLSTNLSVGISSNPQNRSVPFTIDTNGLVTTANQPKILPIYISCRLANTLKRLIKIYIYIYSLALFTQFFNLHKHVKGGLLTQSSKTKNCLKVLM